MNRQPYHCSNRNNGEHSPLLPQLLNNWRRIRRWRAGYDFLTIFPSDKRDGIIDATKKWGVELIDSRSRLWSRAISYRLSRKSFDGWERKGCCRIQSGNRSPSVSWSSFKVVALLTKEGCDPKEANRLAGNLYNLFPRKLKPGQFATSESKALKVLKRVF